MRRIIIPLAAVILLTACDPGVKKIDVSIELPEALKDCTFHSVKVNKDAPTLNVVRCPLSTTSTTYASGKTQVTTVVSEQDTARAEAEARIANIRKEIARLELQAAELERDKLK
jgi:hypothetical protein